MMNLKRKYIQLLKLELDDLKDDIELLVNDCATKKERHTISQYVFMENIALLKNEILCVDCAQKMLDALDLDAYPGLPGLLQDIEARFRSRTEQHGMPPAVNALIKRKLEKVAQYVTKTI